jgi:hypothetical protein
LLFPMVARANDDQHANDHCKPEFSCFEQRLPWL